LKYVVGLQREPAEGEEGDHNDKHLDDLSTKKKTKPERVGEHNSEEGGEKFRVPSSHHPWNFFPWRQYYKMIKDGVISPEG
jgi:hypothetical protein